MSYFLYGSEDLWELVNAYEDYCDRLADYAGSPTKAEEAWQRVIKVRERLGVPVE